MTDQDGGVPAITLSLPILVLVLMVFLAIGGGLSYFTMEQIAAAASPTITLTPTLSPTMTSTPTPITPTVTLSPFPSPTPLTHIVRSGDTCAIIANLFNVSIPAIRDTNGLDANCSLFENQTLSIPQPTPTNTPLATETPNAFQSTLDACPHETYTVLEGETLSLIATVKQVPEEAIMRWNNMTSAFTYEGQKLLIPYCERVQVGASTVTPSPAPPYPQVALLSPVSGIAFESNADVTLTWAALGELRWNEAYQITVTDVTEGLKLSYSVEIPDTELVVPSNLQAEDDVPHIYEWTVQPVARIFVDERGDPVWVEAGPISETRYFSWEGTE
ncbi:MAG: LysM peptidoglycan-binding domain-containing protein [Anaerolineales bacterium]|nr:LysM peptidoglycan-binding domain-containing protein [Anaerolineales bacterium]